MGFNWLFKRTTDLPSRLAGGVADTIDNPQGEGGFGRGLLAGAVQGAGDLVSDMTSPFSLATALAGPVVRGMSGLKQIPKAVGPTIDIIEDLPIKQIMPSGDDVTALIGDMQRNLARIPNKGRATNSMVTPELPPEFVAPGRESLFNAPRMSRMVNERNMIDDMATEGSRNAQRVRVPVAGNVNVADLMANLNRVRGR